MKRSWDIVARCCIFSIIFFFCCFLFSLSTFIQTIFLLSNFPRLFSFFLTFLFYTSSSSFFSCCHLMVFCTHFRVKIACWLFLVSDHDRHGAQPKDKKIIKLKTQNHNCLDRDKFWKGGIRVLTSKETKTWCRGKTVVYRRVVESGKMKVCVKERNRENGKLCAWHLHVFTFLCAAEKNAHSTQPASQPAIIIREFMTEVEVFNSDNIVQQADTTTLTMKKCPEGAEKVLNKLLRRR